ncbi:MAG TPA: sugar transferase [Gemmatimonadaceae bacterium]|nr:sugar transferase [Gemmatimonadaceae bacterium]
MSEPVGGFNDMMDSTVGDARMLGVRPARERRRRSTDDAAHVGGGRDAVRQIALVRDADVVAPQRVAGIHVVPRPRAEVLNRLVNVMLASLALLVLSPLMLLIAAAIKLTSRGPVLYTQTRVGLDRRGEPVTALYDRRQHDHGGRMFTIYKFRSMYVDAEDRTGPVWACKDDPRVTPMGRVLRTYRLDELPQLLNVLRGDMNIVGPRPERPSIFARLCENISEYPLRQRARPGITGWAQVNNSYDASLDDVRVKVRYDLDYIARQSLAEDFKIMLRTVPVMLFRRGGW